MSILSFNAAGSSDVYSGFAEITTFVRVLHHPSRHDCNELAVRIVPGKDKASREPLATSRDLVS